MFNLILIISIYQCKRQILTLYNKENHLEDIDLGGIFVWGVEISPGGKWRILCIFE